MKSVNIIRGLLVVTVLINIVIMALSFFEGQTGSNAGGSIVWLMLVTIPAFIGLVFVLMLAEFFSASNRECKYYIISKRILILVYVFAVTQKLWSDHFDIYDVMFEIALFSIVYGFSILVICKLVKKYFC